MFPGVNVIVKNTQPYLEFVNFSLGASRVVRQNLQNSNTAFQAAASSVQGEKAHACGSVAAQGF